MSAPLWAPWRMPYIERKEKRSEAKACFFCEGATDAAHYRENLVLVVQEHAVSMLNRYPFAPTHVLIAPRRHVGDIADLEIAEYTALMTLLRDVSMALRAAVNCHGMNVGFNLGAVAGAGHAEHVHGHLVPRWPGDTNFMPVIAGLHVMPEALDETWAKLHAAFTGIPGAVVV